MTQYEITKQAIQTAIEDFLRNLGVSDVVPNLDIPENASRGTFVTHIAFRIAKHIGKSPTVVAAEVVDFLYSQQISHVARCEVAGPGFVNIYCDEVFYSKVLGDVLSAGDRYGSNTSQLGVHWVIEHTSPNPNKAMHLGHLRNNLVGMSIIHLLEFSGAIVVADCIDNNRGIAIAKVMWGFLKFMRKDGGIESSCEEWCTEPSNWYTPAERGLLPDLFVTECYVRAEADFKSDKVVEETVRDLVVRWEAHDEAVWKVWEHVLAYSYEGIFRTLARLGNRWDNIWHEHEHYEQGKRYVEIGLEKGVFKQLLDGAILTDLEAYNISDTVLLKNDGTALYITQDIALTALKRERFNADKLVWVIGPEQSLAMQQLFAVCDQLGIGKYSDFTHVAYGYMGLRDDDGNFKKMSSRAGTVVLIDDVIDTVRDAIIRTATENGRTLDGTQAERLALAAVKFNILKPERTQNTSFDTEKSIETKGDSGVYVLYTYARARSIMRKAHESGLQMSLNSVYEDVELSWLLAQFSQVVQQSVESLSVHHVAQYVLALCGTFNSWYGREVVLDGSDSAPYKLALVEAVAQVIKNSMKLIGVEVLEEI